MIQCLQLQYIKQVCNNGTNCMLLHVNFYMFIIQADRKVLFMILSFDSHL